MAFELSTVGAKLAYCVATTANTKPTTGYTVLDDITEAPEIELSAESIEVTNLGDTAKRYIPGLQDPGSEKVFAANNTSAFRTAWGSFVTAAETAYKDGKETYIAYIVDGDDEAYFFTGMPLGLGHGGLSKGAALTCSPRIMLSSAVGYASAPTIGSGD